ncbi:MAG: amidohydrolase [Xanthomonadales bacterium]|nr:amidohydrolase [Xanthomonadales bacterium]
MPDSDLRVSLIQAATIWHDAAANRKLYGDQVRTLAGKTDLIVLPETFTSGFSNDAVDSAETMQGESVGWLRGLAAEAGAVVTGSMVIRDGDAVFNRLLWMRPDGSHASYDKRHLFRMANEHRRYGAGVGREIVELNGWRICPLVCYDLRFPVYLRNRWDREAQRCDYDLLLFVANWPRPRRDAWRTLLRARATENLACVVGVNRVGTDGNGIDYAGDSAVIDASGQPLLELGPAPATVTVCLSAAGVEDWRQRFPAYLDADDFQLNT